MVTTNIHGKNNSNDNNEDLPDFSDPEDYVDDISNEGNFFLFKKKTIELISFFASHRPTTRTDGQRASAGRVHRKDYRHR
jgi:hypothetical protein